MKKVLSSASAALDWVLFGDIIIASGSFGLYRIPQILIVAIRTAGTCDVAVASYKVGVDGFGLGVLRDIS